MEDKRKDLVNTRQKEIINEVVAHLNRAHPSFYYLSTIEIAAEVKKHIHTRGALNHDDFGLLQGLSREDIQILLSFHNQ